MLTPPSHNIFLFEFNFDVKFPLFRLLQFLSDLKSTMGLYATKNVCLQP